MARRKKQAAPVAEVDAAANKSRRLMDPIHGLIPFNDNRVDQVAWELLNTAEFQRLRRIKQLGFSEHVFPGATHSRFSHSIGVFHNARKLVQILQRQRVEEKGERVFESCIAALLHDVGHGPFSHAFEQVQAKIGQKSKSHEEWTAEIISYENGQIQHILGQESAQNIAQSLRNKDPSDIFDSIVASQFDADRLDYLVRDRYMTGVGLGSFDLEWLLDSIRVGKIDISYGDDEEVQVVEGLYLSEKGIRAAEGYLLARFHMYEQVYMHKTTRCMEAMFKKFLEDLSGIVKNRDAGEIGLESDNPLAIFLSGQNLEVPDFLQLTDDYMWQETVRISNSDYGSVSDLAKRLLSRDLYKCVDISRLSRGEADEGALIRFKRKLQEFERENPDEVLLRDKLTLSPYKWHGYEELGALQKVFIGKDAGGDECPRDVNQRSDIIRSLAPVPLFRVYVENIDVQEQIEKIWKGVADA